MSVSQALRALNVNGFILRGEPNSEAEFKNMFTKITGSDEDGNAIESSDPNDFGVIIKEIGLGAFIVMWQKPKKVYDWTPMHWRKELKHARTK